MSLLLLFRPSHGAAPVVEEPTSGGSVGTVRTIPLRPNFRLRPARPNQRPPRERPNWGV